MRAKVDCGEFSPYQTIINNKAPVAYTFDLNVSPGSHTIKVNSGNTGTERYPFVDFATFPASGSGGTDPGADGDADGIPDIEDNCPDDYYPGQRDDHDDGVGIKRDDGSTTPTDTDRYDTRNKSGTKVAGGLTSIVCGLGGNSSDGLQGSPNPAYDRAFTNVWGVCKLMLNTDNAEVRFLHAPNSPGANTAADTATVAVRQ